MIELNHLRYFYEVAQAKSFTAAARSLRVSQSALSRIVALLEAKEGIKLFERSKKGVELTPIGQEVFKKAEEIFTAAAALSTTLSNFKEVCEGHLRFGSSDHIANYLITPKAKKIIKKYPKLIPSVYTGTPTQILELILRDELEFGISFQPTNEFGVIAEEIAKMDMALVINSEMVPQSKKSSLEEVTRSIGYISSVRKSIKHAHSSEIKKLLNKEPIAVFESNSQETQKRLCLNGIGYAYLARFMVQEEIQKKQLVDIKLPKSPELIVYLNRKKSKPLSYNARCFLNELDWVKKQI